jgi:cyclase
MPRTPKGKSWDTGLIEVGDGCHAYIQSGGLNVSNAGLIVGPDSCLVIDALFVQRMTRAFQRAIRKITTRPVRQIVCTHHHADHSLGLIWFRPEVQVIGHEHMRTEMWRAGLDLAHYREVNPEFADDLHGLTQRLPTTTFEGAMTVHLGDRRVELLHLGHGHTKGDVLVYLPDEKLLYTGDVCFNLVTPATFDANIGNWIRVAERILKMKVKTIVPGHGPIGNRQTLKDMLGYLKLVRQEARKRFRAGMTPRRAAGDIPLGGYADWQKPDRLLPTVMKLYQEFRGKPERGLSLRAARGG